MAAADDPADRAFAADRGDFDRAAAAELDGHRDHRRAERETGSTATCVAAREHDRRRARARPTSPYGSISARASAEKVDSKRLPANASSARSSSSVMSRAIGHPLTSRTTRYACGPIVPLQCAGAKLLDHWIGSTGPAADQQAIGDQAKRRDVDQAAALVDQRRRTRGRCRDIRRARRLTWASPSIDSRAPPSSSRTSTPSVGRDRDRPFLALGPAPVEAGGQRPVGLGAGEDDFGGDRRLGIRGNAELGRARRTAPPGKILVAIEKALMPGSNTPNPPGSQIHCWPGCHLWTSSCQRISHRLRCACRRAPAAAASTAE